MKGTGGSSAVGPQGLDILEGNIFIHIQATIQVERDSREGILVGKGGAKLKVIAQQAREDMELLLGTKVFPEVRVRVEKNRSRDPRQLRRFGCEEVQSPVLDT